MLQNVAQFLVQSHVVDLVLRELGNLNIADFFGGVILGMTGREICTGFFVEESR